MIGRYDLVGQHFSYFSYAHLSPESSMLYLPTEAWCFCPSPPSNIYRLTNLYFLSSLILHLLLVHPLLISISLVPQHLLSLCLWSANSSKWVWYPFMTCIGHRHLPTCIGLVFGTRYESKLWEKHTMLFIREGDKNLKLSFITSCIFVIDIVFLFVSFDIRKTRDYG